MKQEQDAEPVALLKRPDSSLLADQLDGAGFVHGVQRVRATTMRRPAWNVDGAADNPRS
jgi:hypothetical protein